MGAFIANFHVRSVDADRVREVLAALGASQFRLSDPGNGWLSVYEERASTQDDQWIERVVRELSAGLKTACIAFLVHDSDIACYWLADQGKILDEYNSAPDYFEKISKQEREQVQGQPHIFLRYCRPDVTCPEVESILRTEVTFAEDIVQKLAGLLGIDPGRALDDFGHGGGGDDGDDEDGDRDGGGPADVSSLVQQAQARFAKMFSEGTDQARSAEGDALVEAASAGNIAEIERLVQAGTKADTPGAMSLDLSGGMNVAAAMPKIPTTPLLAAASKGHAAAVQRLLELGADPNALHRMFGSALHAAAQRGSPETVQVLLSAGVPANLKNAQGHTPRALIQAVRKQVEMARAMVQSMPQLKGVLDQFASRLQAMNLSEAGWDACDELLRQAGG